MKNFGRLLMALGLLLVAGSIPFGSNTATEYLISGQKASATTRRWAYCS
jgi:hypothetical protein